MIAQSNARRAANMAGVLLDFSWLQQMKVNWVVTASLIFHVTQFTVRLFNLLPSSWLSGIDSAANRIYQLGTQTRLHEPIVPAVQIDLVWVHSFAVTQRFLSQRWRRLFLWRSGHLSQWTEQHYQARIKSDRAGHSIPFSSPPPLALSLTPPLSIPQLQGEGQSCILHLCHKPNSV